FRGAWFRFKIIDILPKQNKIKLKYLDYDDDGIQTEMIYQVPPYSTKLNPSNKHLMIRPCYPLMYHKNTMPSVISEVCVVTNGSWKVKDLSKDKF
nr:agenet-like domain-containing protein [Tanacetum cinerariifolium]